MKIAVAVIALGMALSLLSAIQAEGYEKDVHYTLTNHLALWAGFTPSQAAEIAKANQELDSNPAFSALPDCRRIFGNECKSVALGIVNEKLLGDAVAKWKNDPAYQRMISAQRAYHFPSQNRLKELRDSAFPEKNLKVLGHYLHALQDSFAHSLMDSTNLSALKEFDTDRLLASLAYLPDTKILGHFLYGHSLDKTHERPDLAELMARYTYRELIAFNGSPNRYSEIEAAVARFVREEDADRKTTYLKKLPKVDEPPTAQSEFSFQMKNGTVLTGSLETNPLKIKTPFGILAVATKDLASFARGELSLADGTVIKGEILNPSLSVATKFGKLSLPPSEIVSFGTGAQPPKPPQPKTTTPTRLPTH
ncbi:MAG: hypothetical protein G01um1014106_371 [Parcubacteria group bacterium Gr01-1014_106]|nr:MAG: hypothetical protein G01um1014106_371 [Parcubacteria group bacterium Gr01-1014_106]